MMTDTEIRLEIERLERSIDEATDPDEIERLKADLARAIYASMER